MTSRTTLTALAAAAAGAVLTPVAPAALAAQPSDFGCSARALAGSVLGQPLDLGGAAGGSGACADADGAANLPAALGAGTAVARTRLTGVGTERRASAAAFVSDLSLGSLDALTGLIPVPAVPEALRELVVPLPALAELPTVEELPALPIEVPTVPGVTVPLAPTASLPTVSTRASVLPTELRLDLTRAIADVIPTRVLPALDVLKVGALQTRASAACTDGRPGLDGLSQLANVSVLGQALDPGAVVDRAVSLLPAGTVPLDSLDLTKIALPAGLSWDMPVVGPILQTAVRDALAALPPLDLDAVLARVQVTPGSQERTGDRLVQRGPRVVVSALGTPLVDVALGLAEVDATGVDCAPPAAPTQATSTAPASDLALRCTKRKVTLVDVTEHDGHVSLLGAAGASAIGRKVAIVFTATGKQVATGVVRPDGFFRTTAPLPARAIRGTNRARYMAVLDGSKSLALKLQRRMRISKMSNRGGRILLTGKIDGPLVAGQAIVVRQKVSCTKDVVVKRFTPRKAGTWRVWVDAPSTGQAAAYRATTQVFGSAETTRRFDTFTLPGYVAL